MNHKYLSLALAIGACLGLAACSDNTPDDATSAPPAANTATAPASNGDAAVAAAPVETIVAPWTGDLAAATAEPHCALDVLNGSPAADGKLTLPTGDAARFEGWVATSDMHSAPTFSLVLDGATDYQLSGGTGVSRDDVAKAYSTDQLANAGFRLDVPSLAIPVGDYKLVLVHQENGAWMSCETNQVLTVN
jgi:hypothetical protein